MFCQVWYLIYEIQLGGIKTEYKWCSVSWDDYTNISYILLYAIWMCGKLREIFVNYQLIRIGNSN